jgi:hypothetical protein
MDKNPIAKAIGCCYGCKGSIRYGEAMAAEEFEENILFQSKEYLSRPRRSAPRVEMEALPMQGVGVLEPSTRLEKTTSTTASTLLVWTSRYSQPMNFMRTKSLATQDLRRIMRICISSLT